MIFSMWVPHRFPLGHERVTQSFDHLARWHVAPGGYSRRMRSTMTKVKKKVRLISLTYAAFCYLAAYFPWPMGSELRMQDGGFRHLTPVKY